MPMTMTHSNGSFAIDQRLIERLQTYGPQTLEDLCAHAGVAWAQGFLAIDRLSRAGVIALRQARRCEYRVSLNKVVA